MLAGVSCIKGDGGNLNPIIPTIALKKSAEFVARIGMSLYVKWHNRASHERAERYRVRLAELELKRKMDKEIEK
jgi:hypothetical protein